MAGLTDYLAAGVAAQTSEGILGYITGQIIMAALPSVWLGLFTTAPTSDSGVTGAVEPSTNAYARIQVAGTTVTTSVTTASTTINVTALPAWIQPGMSVYDVTTPASIPVNPVRTVVSVATNSFVLSGAAVTVSSGDTLRLSAFAPPTFSSGAEPVTVPAFCANNSIITFAQATGAGWGTIVAWALFDAATTGNNLFWDWLGNFKWNAFTATLASPSVITSTAHGYANGDNVVVTAKFDGGLLPTSASWAGIQTVASATTDTFTLTGINATVASGEGLVRKITQQPIAGAVTASFAVNTFFITAA